MNSVNLLRRKTSKNQVTNYKLENVIHLTLDQTNSEFCQSCHSSEADSNGRKIDRQHFESFPNQSWFNFEFFSNQSRRNFEPRRPQLGSLDPARRIEDSGLERQQRQAADILERRETKEVSEMEGPLRSWGKETKPKRNF